MAIHHPPRPVRPRPAVRDHREVSRPVIREHREPVRWERRDRDDDRRRVIVEHPIYQTSVWTASPGYTYVPQPIQLMAPTALSSEALTLDVNLGGATTLQLQNAGSGSTYVSQILLIEPDGDTQAVPVNAILSPANPTVQLPVGNSAGVSRIVVEGHSDWGGSLALQAV